MSFARFLEALDADLVNEKYRLIYDGAFAEYDGSDEAFAAVLLAVRDEGLKTSSGRSERFHAWHFRDARAQGAECAIGAVMSRVPDTYVARRPLVRDMIETSGGKAKEKRQMRVLLECLDDDVTENDIREEYG